MEFVVRSSKVFRKIALHGGVAVVWIGTLAFGVFWLDEANRRVGMKAEGSPRLLAALLLGFWLFAEIVILPSRLRSGFRLAGRRLHRASGSFDLAGPSYMEQKSLVVTTSSGPIVIEDFYTSPLPEIRDRLNTAWWGDRQTIPPSSRISLPESGIPDVDSFVAGLAGGDGRGPILLKDRGHRWAIHPGWLPPVIFTLALSVAFLEFRFPKIPAASTRVVIILQEEIRGLEAFRKAGVAFILALGAAPWLLACLVSPTRRYRSWMLVSPRYLILCDQTVRIVPTSAVLEVGNRSGGAGRELTIRCKDGKQISIPDAALQREVALACGLDPDRHIGLFECAERLGCSRWRAWFAMAEVPGLHQAGRKILRAKFLEKLPELREGLAKGRSGGRFANVPRGTSGWECPTSSSSRRGPA
jgi:hypothetical protein